MEKVSHGERCEMAVQVNTTAKGQRHFHAELKGTEEDSALALKNVSRLREVVNADKEHGFVQHCECNLKPSLLP